MLGTNEKLRTNFSGKGVLPKLAQSSAWDELNCQRITISALTKNSLPFAGHNK